METLPLVVEGGGGEGGGRVLIGGERERNCNHKKEECNDVINVDEEDVCVCVYNKN